MKVSRLIAFILLCVTPLFLLAQEDSTKTQKRKFPKGLNFEIFDLPDSTDEDYHCDYSSFDLAVNNNGISFGNSSQFNGIRFNGRDCGVELINGINITFWRPVEYRISGTINGLSLGLFPAAEKLNGINLGLAGVLTEHSSNGINIGGLAVVSQNNINGVNFGGLSLVAQGKISGLNIGGLAVVSQDRVLGISLGGLAVVTQEDLLGINFGGFALVSQENMIGINLSGLASVSQGKLVGINIAGLANVSQGMLHGINISGLANVTQEDMFGFNLAGIALVSQTAVRGVNIGGLAVVGEDYGLYGLSVTLGKLVGGNRIAGLNIAGYKIETGNLNGFSTAVGWIEAETLRGVGISIFNEISNRQRGLTIGLLNYAENLKGIQIGLLNIAENNPNGFKYLPFVNAHF